MQSGEKYENNRSIRHPRLVQKLQKGHAAFTTSFKTIETISSAVYVNPGNHTTIENGKPFISTNHAYAVVGIDDEYIYLEESNNPGKHIRISKEEFIASAETIASYRWE